MRARNRRAIAHRAVRPADDTANEVLAGNGAARIRGGIYRRRRVADHAAHVIPRGRGNRAAVRSREGTEARADYAARDRAANTEGTGIAAARSANRACIRKRREGATRFLVRADYAAYEVSPADGCRVRKPRKARIARGASNDADYAAHVIRRTRDPSAGSLVRSREGKRSRLDQSDESAHLRHTADGTGIIRNVR